MASKKGQVVQLQLEVNTEEQWQKLLEKDGLTGKHCDKLSNFGNTMAVLKQSQEIVVIYCRMFKKSHTNSMPGLLISTSVHLVILLVCISMLVQTIIYL
jgi:hypothetical protein